MSKKNKRGRDAITGKFVSVEKAKKYPKTHVVETIENKNKCKK